MHYHKKADNFPFGRCMIHYHTDQHRNAESVYTVRHSLYDYIDYTGIYKILLVYILAALKREKTRQ